MPSTPAGITSGLATLTDGDPFLTDETAKHVQDAAQGNPGAQTVIREFCWFTRWYEMMYWCRATGFVGPKVWEKHKDEFHQDVHALGEWMQEHMRKDANRPDPPRPEHRAGQQEVNPRRPGTRPLPQMTTS